MGASWLYQLCDAQGSPLAELATAAGRSVNYRRNTYTEASFTLSHDDDAASLLFGALASTGMPTLRCYRRADGAEEGTLRFRGYLAAMQEDVEEQALATCVFRSPFGRVVGDGNDGGRFLTSDAYYVNTDAGEIAVDLIDLANAQGATGLGTAGTVETTVPRDRNYTTGQNVGQAVGNLTSVLDGFDFYETYVDGVTTTIAQFNVVASQGSDNPAARFEYGEGTLANVRGLNRQTEPPANSVFVTGANGLTSEYEDAASIAQYGVWPLKADFSDVVEQSTLDAKARALVRPFPVRTVTFSPDAALAPQPFDDYAIGDTVRLYARRGALLENTALRVNGFTVMVDEDGREAAEIQDPTSPEEDAVMRASITAEVTDAPEAP